MEIHLARSADEIRRCFPVVVQLRTHLSESNFVGQVQLQSQEIGYQLAYVAAPPAGGQAQEPEVVAVAGFVIRHMLSAGKVLYFDDLVTDAAARSGGYGAALYAWLEDYARRAACNVLDLDSGVQRFDAHRFYFRQGMHIFAYHFRHRLQPLE
jgi:GNAT superfamily N-acetyltransferase